MKFQTGNLRKIRTPILYQEIFQVLGAMNSSNKTGLDPSPSKWVKPIPIMGTQVKEFP